MQKWEYFVTWFDRQTLKDRHQSIEDALNNYGTNGWELVAVFPRHI